MNAMPDLKRLKNDRVKLRAWLAQYEGNAEGLEYALSKLAKEHVYVHQGALETGETDIERVFTKLPLYNHLVPVLEPEHQTVGGLPSGDVHDAAFIAIHKDHIHRHCGQEHRGIPVEAYRDWLVAHKHDAAALDPVVLLFHNRNIIVNVRAMKRGETDPAKLFEVKDREDSHLKRDGDGAKIIPLDQIFIARCYGDHHDWKHGPIHGDKPTGGEQSERAIAALDHFLETVMGIRANHKVIKSRFAKTPRGRV